jgi:hypothetical protein
MKQEQSAPCRHNLQYLSASWSSWAGSEPQGGPEIANSDKQCDCVPSVAVCGKRNCVTSVIVCCDWGWSVAQ